MINYSGDIDVSGSASGSNGERVVFSGDLGVDLSLTYGGSGTGTGFETVDGSLLTTVYYKNGGTHKYNVPFDLPNDYVQIKQGAVTVTPSTIVSFGGIAVTITGSGTITDNLEEITETITAMGSGTYDGVSFSETVEAQGTMVAAPPSQNTHTVTGTVSAGYTLAPIYGVIDITSTGGIGGTGLGVATASTVTNYGSVGASGSGSGIKLTDGGFITNHTNGVISGAVGIYLGGGVGRVSNSGTIQGALAGVDAGAGSTATVINYGTIEATNFGVVLKSAGDRLLAGMRSTIVGRVVGGGGTLELESQPGVFETIAGLGAVGTVSGEANMTFTGFGAYVLDSGGEWGLSGTNRLAGGQTLTIDGALVVVGSLINAGTIAEGGAGIALSGQGFLENSVATAVIQGEIYGAGDFAATFENFGTVVATGGSDAVSFSLPDDRLIAEAGSKIVGSVNGGGGTLELAGGTGTISGVGGAGTLTGATAMTFSDFGSVVVEAGASWTAFGGVASTLANFGSLTVARTLAAGVLSIAGGICTLAAGAGLTNSYVDLSGGELVIQGSRVYTDGWNQSGGTLSIAAGATLSLSSADDLSGWIVGAGTLAITGYTQFGRLPQFTVAAVRIAGGDAEALMDASLSYAGVWTQVGGILYVAAPASLTLRGAADSFTGSNFQGDGAIAFVGGADTLTSVSFVNTESQGPMMNVAITNAAMTLGGLIDNDATIDASSGHLVIAASGATLTGNGRLILSDHVDNRIYGATSTATLLNRDSTITGAGDLGGGSMSLVNQGVIDGDDTIALVIDTGAATIVNGGLIEATGAGGVKVMSAIVNTYRLSADGGVLMLDGPVTGGGEALIDDGTLVAGEAFTEAVAFGAAGGELVLAQSQSYANKISGFSLTGSTSLDLRDIQFVGAGEAHYSGTATGGVLTLSDGTHTAKIHLTGNYTATTFTAKSDHRGGVVIVASGAEQPTSPHAFVAAMAGLASPTGAAVHTDTERTKQETLMAPPTG
jgi:hypothetical protein